MNKRRVYVKTFVVFIVVSLCVSYISYMIYNNMVREEQLKAKYAAQSTADRIQAELEKYLEKSDFIKKTIESGIDIDETLFSSIGSRMYNDNVIKAIELAPDGIVNEIYPKEGNEKAYGLNMLKDHERKTSAQIAKESKEYTVAGPYDLKQGGKGALLLIRDTAMVNFGEFLFLLWIGKHF